MRIGLLGAIEVTADAGPVVIGGQRLRAVLARLALDAGRLVTVDSLVDDVWGDDPPAGAVNALQSLVSRLRRALPDNVVESLPSGYRLRVPRESVDVHRFGELASDGRRALAGGDAEQASDQLAASLRLWRGPALADVGDAPFRGPTATRLENERLAAVEDRIEADLALGRHADVVPELEALTVAHPLRERPHAQLVLALDGAGRHADALATFDRVRHRLADELGIDPGPALTSAHATVLAGPSAPRARVAVRAPARVNGVEPTVRGNLRPQLTRFVGRERDLATLADLLGHERLVTLVGPGGAGKTRLAEETAARLTGTVPGGVWMVPLAPVGDGGDLLQTVITPLGRRQLPVLDPSLSGLETKMTDVRAELVRTLSSNVTVLVLDNCEHLVGPVAALVHGLLLDCPRLRVLATSREPLGVPGERLHAVSRLELPPERATPDEALEYSAVQLLVDRAAAAQPGFTVDVTNVAALVEICRRLDGMPLALELAAARLRSLSPDQLAARLSDRFRVLTGGSRTVLPRHQTLRAVVAWSWDLLTERERALWRRLSVFPGGADLESAEEVCGDPPGVGALLPVDDVLDTLASLIDKSLIELVGDSGNPRYRMLETMRAYGTEQLEHAGETHRLLEARTAYYLALVETAEPKLRGPEQAGWMARLVNENENIIAALRWAIDQERAETAIRMAAAMVWYQALRGAHGEAKRWTSAALAVPGESPPEARALVMAFATLATMGTGQEYEKGRAMAAEVVAVVEEMATTVDAHPVLMLAAGITALLAEQNDKLTLALVQAERHKDPWVRALSIFLRATMAENDGEAVGSEPLYVDAKQQFEEIGDNWGTSMALNALASVRALRGDHAGAIEALDEAKNLMAGIYGIDDLPRTLLWLALEWSRVGDVDRARAYLDEAHDLMAANGDTDNVSGWFASVHGTVLRHTGDLQTSVRLLNDALADYEKRPYGPPQIKALMLADLAYSLVAIGSVAEARQRIGESVDAAEESRDSPVLGGTLDAVAAVVLAAGDAPAAARVLGTAVKIRGVADKGSPDVRLTVERCRAALGDEAFEACYREGVDTERADVPDLARRLLAGTTPRTEPS